MKTIETQVQEVKDILSNLLGITNQKFNHNGSNEEDRFYQYYKNKLLFSLDSFDSRIEDLITDEVDNVVDNAIKDALEEECTYCSVKSKCEDCAHEFEEI